MKKLSAAQREALEAIGASDIQVTTFGNKVFTLSFLSNVPHEPRIMRRTLESLYRHKLITIYRREWSSVFYTITKAGREALEIK